MTKTILDYKEDVKKRLFESAAIKQKTATSCMDSILDAAQLLIDTFKLGNKVLICGNGGSAADSQHMAGELVCMLNKTIKRPPLPAIALTTDTSILTAFSNDVSFDDVFERQVEALGKPKDILIAISTSGNSKNVLVAVKKAKRIKMHTIALTGDKGILQKIADIAICVPSKNTQYIQEIHLAIEHILCEIVEDYIYGNK